MTVDDAVRQVYEAWTKPGPDPEKHQRAQRRLHHEWPALAGAVATLVTTLDTANESR